MSETKLPEREEFSLKATWDGATGGEVEAKGLPRLKIDTPREFGGRGGGYCPDQLFLSSVAGCLLTTFLFFKRRLNVEVESIEVSANCSVVKTREGYRIKSVNAKIRVKAGEKQKKLVEKCLSLTKQYCHITKTIEPVVDLNVEWEVIQLF